MADSFGFEKGGSRVKRCVLSDHSADVSSLATLVFTKSSVSGGEDRCARTERSVFTQAQLLDHTHEWTWLPGLTVELLFRDCAQEQPFSVCELTLRNVGSGNGVVTCGEKGKRLGVTEGKP